MFGASGSTGSGGNPGGGGPNGDPPAESGAHFKSKSYWPVRPVLSYTGRPVNCASSWTICAIDWPVPLLKPGPVRIAPQGIGPLRSGGGGGPTAPRPGPPGPPGPPG